MIGMAFADPFNPEPDAFQAAKASYGLDGIVRAGRMKTTVGSQETGNSNLIEPDES